MQATSNIKKAKINAPLPYVSRPAFSAKVSYYFTFFSHLERWRCPFAFPPSLVFRPFLHVVNSKVLSTSFQIIVQDNSIHNGHFAYRASSTDSTMNARQKYLFEVNKLIQSIRASQYPKTVETYPGLVLILKISEWNLKSHRLRLGVSFWERQRRGYPREA